MSLDDLARTSTTSLLNAAAARTDTAAGQTALHLTLRRRRIVSTTLAAAATAAVLVFGSLVLVQPADEPVPQPAGPPADGRGLSAPLEAPSSLMDVRTLGFHVAPLSGFNPQGVGAGWAIDDQGQTVTLRWALVADEVAVHVGYQGAPPPDPTQQFTDGQPTADKEVTVGGAVGHYYDEFGIYGLDGSYRALLVWEYAPDSWAHVFASSDRMNPGEAQLRSALVDVANAVRPGGASLRVPIRIGALPPSTPAASGVSMRMVDGWETAVFFGPHLAFTVGSGAVPQACEDYDGGFVETFTYRGQSGCLNGYGTPDHPSTGSQFSNFNAVSLRTGRLVRTVEVIRSESGDTPEYPLVDLKQALAELTVAPPDDQSSWFDLATALTSG